MTVPFNHIYNEIECIVSWLKYSIKKEGSPTLW